MQTPTRLIDPPHARGIMLMPTRYIEPKHAGWTVFAGLMLLLAPLVLAHHPAGVFFAIIATGLNALGHVLGFGSRPGWSIVALVIDALVMFALVSYGFRVRDVSSPFRS